MKIALVGGRDSQQYPMTSHGGIKTCVRTWPGSCIAIFLRNIWPLDLIIAHRERHGHDGVKLSYCPHGIRPGEVIANRGGLIPLGEVTDTMDRCGLPSRTVNIDCEGNLVLCCNDYLESFRFGNISTNGLLEIWNRPYNAALRAMLQRDTSKIDICRKCRLGTFQ